ncbi:ethanolamine ammonia-lyase subunit EutC [Pseudaeromonas sharmana]|uniref:Ethanolamine ammonia-lyase small subunit n=1 Tax=Pseudaeromonas sharmana TaxID=328412 RepID=A0ABV8CN92_9GAMM
MTPTLVQSNPWQELRQFTAARIALGRTGASLPTEALLQFGLAHAQARDAVHQPLDFPALQLALAALGLPTITLHSAARHRDEYLRRPDLGRRLDSESAERLTSLANPACDVALVIADGLSSTAIAHHAEPLLRTLLPQLEACGLSVGPLTLIAQGRVAIGDEIGALLNARLVVVLIGERPGLSSPDSLGLYLTWHPQPGRMDSERNCISNVRPAGLDYPQAVHKLQWLIDQAFTRRLTGVQLKDESDELLLTHAPERPCAIRSEQNHTPNM